MISNFSKSFPEVEKPLCEIDKKKMEDDILARQLKFQTAVELRSHENSYLDGDSPAKHSSHSSSLYNSIQMRPGYPQQGGYPGGYQPQFNVPHDNYNTPPAPPQNHNPNVIELPVEELKFINIPNEIREKFSTNLTKSLEKEVELGDFRQPQKKKNTVNVPEDGNNMSVNEVIVLMLNEIIALKQENKELKTICNRIDKRLSTKYPIERKKKNDE